jgi:hypothetical protein
MRERARGRSLDPRRGRRCTFAQARSASSCGGVASINRSSCKASAEPLTTISRSPFVVLQPNFYIFGARAGNRTLNLGIKSPLLCQLSYASTS